MFDKWLFRIGAIGGAIGGICGFLYWAEIKPKDLRVGLMGSLPHAAGLVIGLLLFALSLGLSFYSIYRVRKLPSKLTIHSATYAAVNGKGKSCDVTEFMQQIITGDSLVLEIENHNFVANGRNFVPNDPCPNDPKRLQVKYSYDGNPSITIERKEGSRLVLPEDSEIKELMNLRESDSRVAEEASSLAEQLRRELTAKNSEIEALEPVLIDGVGVIGYATDFMRQRAKWNPTPDVTNVKGEILETLYRPDYSRFGFTGFDLLLRVRLINFGSNAATITRYRARIDIGKDYWNGDNADIPSLWTLEREDPLTLLGGSKITETILPLNSDKEPLIKGIPQTGWLMFKMSQGWIPGFQIPVGAQVSLIVTDAFGTDHVIVKPCGKYATKAQIVTTKG